MWTSWVMQGPSHPGALRSREGSIAGGRPGQGRLSLDSYPQLACAARHDDGSEAERRLPACLPARCSTVSCATVEKVGGPADFRS